MPGYHSIFVKDTEYTPEKSGYSSAKIKEIDDYLCGLIDEKILNAAGYLISKDGKVIALRSMGKLRVSSNEEDFKPDSIRRIASITKLFTSVCILQLVDMGRLRYDQPVADIIDEFKHPLYNKIKIIHLLTHTSGLKPEPGIFFEPYQNQYVFNSKDWIMENLRGFPSVEPGREWRYCSFGFVLLAEIVSRMSGVNFEKYLTDNVLKPLGMDTTFFDVPKDLEDRICFSTESEEKWYFSRGERPEWAPPRGGGGLFSTLPDLQKLGQMLVNKGSLNGVRIVSRKGVEAMTRNHLSGVKNYCWGEGGTEWEYGLGMNVYSNNTFLSPGSFAHEGAGLSGLFMDPVENVVFAYFCPPDEKVQWDPRPVINLRNMVWAGII